MVLNRKNSAVNGAEAEKKSALTALNRKKKTKLTALNQENGGLNRIEPEK